MVLTNWQLWIGQPRCKWRGLSQPCLYDHWCACVSVIAPPNVTTTQMQAQNDPRVIGGSPKPAAGIIDLPAHGYGSWKTTTRRAAVLSGDAQGDRSAPASCHLRQPPSQRAFGMAQVAKLYQTPVMVCPGPAVSNPRCCRCDGADGFHRRRIGVAPSSPMRWFAYRVGRSIKHIRLKEAPPLQISMILSRSIRMILAH